MRDKSAALLVFVIALAVYLMTLAPDITWAHFGQDGGDLITAATTLGVPHPSGYPTYVLLGKLWSYLPLGTVAYRFNLLSAVCMAGAAGMIVLGGDKQVANMAAGLTFAFTPLVWSQAIITEVYALNLLLLTMLIYVAGHHADDRPVLVGLLWGLSITTHLTSALWLPFVVWQTRGQWHKVMLGSVIGLSPFLALFGLARTASPINWFDPSTIHNWWFVISGAIYRPNVFSHPVMPRLTAAMMPSITQFGVIGTFFVMMGMVLPTADHDDKNKKRIIIVIAFLYLFYALTYDTPDAAVFALPALLVGAILLKDGLQWIRSAAFLLPIMLVSIHAGQLNLHDDLLAKRRMTAAANMIAPNAIVLTSGDETIFSLWYYHYVEGVRPDIIPIDENLFQFDWYRKRLALLYPDVEALEADDLPTFKVTNRIKRPICFVSLPNDFVDCHLDA